jgi:hypothetical protein
MSGYSIEVMQSNITISGNVVYGCGNLYGGEGIPVFTPAPEPTTAEDLAEWKDKFQEALTLPFGPARQSLLRLCVETIELIADQSLQETAQREGEE